MKATDSPIKGLKQTSWRNAAYWLASQGIIRLLYTTPWPADQEWPPTVGWALTHQLSVKKKMPYRFDHRLIHGGQWYRYFFFLLRSPFPRLAPFVSSWQRTYQPNWTFIAKTRMNHLLFLCPVPTVTGEMCSCPTQPGICVFPVHAQW